MLEIQYSDVLSGELLLLRLPSRTAEILILRHPPPLPVALSNPLLEIWCMMSFSLFPMNTSARLLWSSSFFRHKNIVFF